MEKVYCENCKYLNTNSVSFCKEFGWIDFIKLFCDHDEAKQSTFFSSKTITENSRCLVMNKNNDCKWYKKFEIVKEEVDVLPLKMGLWSKIKFFIGSLFIYEMG